jgi:hypothetical protein
MEDGDNIIRMRVPNGSKWSHEEMKLLHQLKRAGHTYSQIAEIMAKSIGRREYCDNLCYKKWQQTDWEEFLKESGDRESLLEEIEDREAEKQKVIDSTLAQQEKLVRREQARTELIIDALKSAIFRLPKPKPSDISYGPPSNDKYSAEHAALLLSDLHIGASYTLDDTGGFSEYNLEIFQQRLEALKSAVIEVVERHRHVYEVPELHIFCLGDIVAGMNDAGNWSSVYIDQDIYDQMMIGVASLRELVASLSRGFQKVHFYGIYGNHGRIGKRGTHKDSTNWDRIIYEFVKTSLVEYDNIRWVIPTAWWHQENVLGHNFFLTHGDGIRSSMGIPYYGVERAERNITGLMKEMPPDYMLIGHFHSAAEIQTNSSRIIMNGSFMGGDMYSLRDLRRADYPEQKVFGIHEKKGVTWTYNIHLGSEKVT